MARKLISFPAFAILLIACLSLLALASPVPYFPIEAIKDTALSEDVVEPSLSQFFRSAEFINEGVLPELTVQLDATPSRSKIWVVQTPTNY
ncbi:hypothetical protein EDB19DRAFT_1913744 [Suillus lakei]|nr:hypothetical protein EDB19DRAFT_1913744 [Suillus lakei]